MFPKGLVTINFNTSGNAALEENVQASAESLGIEAGQILPAGTSFTDFVKALIQETLNPTFIAPSFSLTISNSSLRIVDSNPTVTLTFNFNRGQIVGNLVGGVWDANAIQNPRAGVAISYLIDGANQAGNQLTKAINSNVPGITAFTATVTYGIGPQPVNSENQNFDSPLPGGTSATQTLNVEWVYPIFASTNVLTTATQQALQSMINANNIEYTLVAEDGTNKQFFEIPTSWLSGRALSKIEFFNTVSNGFDPTDQLTTFTQSNITKTIEGNSVPYTRFTNNRPNRGEITIKLVF